MRVLNTKQKINLERYDLLQRLEYLFEKGRTESIYFPIYNIKDGWKMGQIETPETISLLKEFKEEGLIDFIERPPSEVNKTLEKVRGTVSSTIIEGYNIKKIEPKFSEACNKYYLIARRLDPAENKDNSVREEIRLKTLGLKIQGNSIFRTGEKSKKVFNRIERDVIYFLYFNFQKNKDECFNLKIIAQEFNITTKYLKNIITDIHKKIGVVISKNTPPKINFIKNEKGRGYHLNPKLLI